MRKAIALTLALGVSGCAAHHAAPPAAVAVPPPPPASDWSAVSKLPTGAFVLVALDGNDGRRGLISGVTDATLTIRDAYGTVAIPRARIARVTNRVQTGTKRASRWLGVPIVTAVLGGLAAVVAGAIGKNSALKQTGWMSLVVGMTVGVAAGPLDYPRAVFADHVIYVRP